ncbi:MAG: hypothetical protein J6386_12485 [Candidatus Synoicihabitans palmerolidicus]|nr:hypothetical protein [Candidatus Synoicihabitans palmerolidicus]
MRATRLRQQPGTRRTQPCANARLDPAGTGTEWRSATTGAATPAGAKTTRVPATVNALANLALLRSVLLHVCAQHWPERLLPHVFESCQHSTHISLRAIRSHS